MTPTRHTYDCGSAFRTDRGPRPDTQDNALVGDNFIVVADGVSSVAGSDAAAAVVVDTYASIAKHLSTTDNTFEELWRAPTVIGERLRTAGSRGVSTAAAALLDDHGRLWITHVGDSAVVVMTSSGIQSCTRPHHQAEYAYVTGDSDPVARAATHKLLRAVGADRNYAPPELAVHHVSEPTVVIAATDGITTTVALKDMYDMWIEHMNIDRQGPTSVGPDLRSRADTYSERILNRANEAGLQDNATVAVLVIEAKDPRYGGTGY